MPLTLTIRNASELENGSPLSLVLDSRGAIIGRSATTDWCLPDAALHISSRHCEVRFADGRYELIDTSTNGTFLNRESARLAAPHTIVQGDMFLIGRFEIEARLDDASAAAAAQRNAAPDAPQWQGWNAAAGQPEPAPAPQASPSGWDSPLPSSAASGWDAAPQAPLPPPAEPASQGWAASPAADLAPSSAGGGWGSQPAPAAAPAPTPAPLPTPSGSSPSGQSPWDVAPAPVTPASDWSSPVAAPSPPGGDDIWGRFAASNVVDWDRGGFGSPVPAPLQSGAPLPSIAAVSFEPQPMVEASPTAHTTPPTAMPAPVQAGTVAPQGDGLAAFLAAAGVDPARIEQGDAQTLAAAGDVLRRFVSGIVVLLEARARAKSQMGAQGTSLEFDGNNPLKFARTPEQALAQLLNPAARGFMSSERAVEDAFKDLQAHQMATLIAMQGALRATLERFSPTAIRSRAETKGILAKILPGARNSALWNAYEREFSGVAVGSDEAFMDMFAKEFRRAYEDIAKSK